MRLRTVTVVAVAIALALGACSSDDKDKKDSGGSTTTTTVADRTVKITAADDGTTIQVAEGDTIEATVESSAGIPFTWRVLDLDDQVLVQVPGSGEDPVTGADMPGGKQAYAFLFDVEGTGTSPLTIGLVSITDESDVAQRLSVTVDAS